MADKKYVKHVIRYIARGMPISNSEFVDEVDNYMSELYLQGYTLFATHYLGENTEGYGILYILHRSVSPAK